MPLRSTTLLENFEDLKKTENPQVRHAIGVTRVHLSLSVMPPLSAHYVLSTLFSLFSAENLSLYIKAVHHLIFLCLFFAISVLLVCLEFVIIPAPPGHPWISI